MTTISDGKECGPDHITAAVRYTSVFLLGGALQGAPGSTFHPQGFEGLRGSLVRVRLPLRGVVTPLAGRAADFWGVRAPGGRARPAAPGAFTADGGPILAERVATEFSLSSAVTEVLRPESVERDGDVWNEQRTPHGDPHGHVDVTWRPTRPRAPRPTRPD